MAKALFLWWQRLPLIRVFGVAQMVLAVVIAREPSVSVAGQIGVVYGSVWVVYVVAGLMGIGGAVVVFGRGEVLEVLGVAPLAFYLAMALWGAATASMVTSSGVIMAGLLMLLLTKAVVQHG